MSTASGSGLERLQWLSSVNVIQKFGSYTGNEYVVQSEGKELFFLKEYGPCLLPFLSMGQFRRFDMYGTDTVGRTVFSLRRPNAFMAWSDKVELYMNNTLMSVVRQENTLMTPIFSINDAQDCPILMVKGEVFNFHYDFQLQARDKTAIGGITKKYAGILKELLTYMDDYVITFPADLDVNFKLAVIGACILIDYRYHED